MPLLLRMCQGVEEAALQAGDVLFEEGKPLDKVTVTDSSCPVAQSLHTL